MFWGVELSVPSQTKKILVVSWIYFSPNMIKNEKTIQKMNSPQSKKFLGFSWAFLGFFSVSRATVFFFK